MLAQLITTLPDRQAGMSLARDVVDRRLAACVQVIDPITSVYRWEGERQEETEYLCLLKTPLDGLERLVAFVRERHPYDTPEITAVESLFTDERYLAWAREVSGESAGGVPRRVLEAGRAGAPPGPANGLARHIGGRTPRRSRSTRP